MKSQNDFDTKKETQNDFDTKKETQNDFDTKKETQNEFDTKKKFACNKCNYASNKKQVVKKHQRTRRHENDIDLKVLYLNCKKCHKNIEHDHSVQQNGPKKKFPCSKCEYSSNWKWMVRRHQRSGIHKNDVDLKVFTHGIQNIDQENEPSYNKGGKFKCQNSGCKFVTDSTIALNKHQECIHLKIVKYKCNICSYGSYQSSPVRIHQKNQHSNNLACKVLKIGCELCDRNDIKHNHRKKSLGTSTVKDKEQRSEKSKVIKTKGKKRKRDTIKCNECEHKVFPSFRLRVKHYIQEHKNKHIFNCDHCKYGSNYHPNLQMHINSQHLKMRLQCTECSYQTTWKTSFLMHMREKHKQYQKLSKHFPTGENVLCEECGSSINPNDLNRSHECSKDKINEKKTRNIRSNSSVQIGKYKCNKCDFCTDQPSDVRAHYELNHKNAPEIQSNRITLSTSNKGFMLLSQM